MDDAIYFEKRESKHQRQPTNYALANATDNATRYEDILHYDDDFLNPSDENLTRAAQ